MTLRKFAQATGIAPATLSRFTHGKEMDYSTVIKICRHYDSELAEEVEALLHYVRKALMRRMKEPRSPNDLPSPAPNLPALCCAGGGGRGGEKGVEGIKSKN